MVQKKSLLYGLRIYRNPFKGGVSNPVLFIVFVLFPVAVIKYSNKSNMGVKKVYFSL